MPNGVNKCLLCGNPILRTDNRLWDQDECGYIHIACAIQQLRRVLKEHILCEHRVDCVSKLRIEGGG
jgi:hypothetical protein